MRDIELLIEVYLIAVGDLVAAIDTTGGAVPSLGRPDRRRAAPSSTRCRPGSASGTRSRCLQIRKWQSLRLA